MKKTTLLRRMIESQHLEFLMEAHNGLSAKIVEEAGFKGIWGSGLSISAALGVRDNNEASWTQVMEVVEFMSDATTIPILLDGDTGYGNFNNMRRLVRKLEQRNVAGVCIEDKIFPKTNSFLRREAQPLADIEEFCGKIKAGKDSQNDEDFVIVARVEAFIAGWGLKEAIKRAEAYWQAGADAILIHSKLSHPNDILSFTKEWNNRAPVVIVPTKYYSTPTEVFRKNNISIAIWANHLLRGALQKMQEVAGQIYKEENLHNVEDVIVPVSEVFRMQGDQELQEAEKQYLKRKDSSFAAVVLAVWQGRPLGKVTEDIPKTMIKIGGTSILEKMVNTLKEYSIRDITVVAGYKREAINLHGLRIVENTGYRTTGQMESLAKGIDGCKRPSIILFGDILFKKYILQLLLDDPADIVLAVDSMASSRAVSHKSDYITATIPDNESGFEKDSFLKKITYQLLEGSFDGEWIGIMKLSKKGVEYVKEYIKKFEQQETLKEMQIRDMLNYFVDTGIKVKIQYIHGHWIDVDTINDLQTASNF